MVTLIVIWFITWQTGPRWKWQFWLVPLAVSVVFSVTFSNSRVGRLRELRLWLQKKMSIKPLMTGPKGNSEFCFPKTLHVPQGEAEGNIEVEGKQKSLCPTGPVIKCFVIPPNSKIEKKKLRRNRLLEAGWLTNLPRFQGSSCCFPRELVSF